MFNSQSLQEYKHYIRKCMQFRNHRWFWRHMSCKKKGLFSSKFPFYEGCGEEPIILHHERPKWNLKSVNVTYIQVIDCSTSNLCSHKFLLQVFLEVITSFDE